MKHTIIKCLSFLIAVLFAISSGCLLVDIMKTALNLPDPITYTFYGGYMAVMGFELDEIYYFVKRVLTYIGFGDNV